MSDPTGRKAFNNDGEDEQGDPTKDHPTTNGKNGEESVATSSQEESHKSLHDSMEEANLVSVGVELAMHIDNDDELLTSKVTENVTNAQSTVPVSTTPSNAIPGASVNVITTTSSSAVSTASSNAIPTAQIRPIRFEFLIEPMDILPNHLNHYLHLNNHDDFTSEEDDTNHSDDLNDENVDEMVGDILVEMNAPPPVSPLSSVNDEDGQPILNHCGK